MNADGEGDEEGAAKEEHLVAAQVPPSHNQWNEEYYAGRQYSQLDSPKHLSNFCCKKLTIIRGR